MQNKFIILIGIIFITACEHKTNFKNLGSNLQQGVITMNKQAIYTDNAPKAIGVYSQAIRAGNTVYLSGQLGFNPKTMELESGFEAQARQMFENLNAVVIAANGSLADIVKLNIYLTDMANFPIINKVMESYFKQPYPARAAVGVKELPRGGLVEVEAIMVTNN